MRLSPRLLALPVALAVALTVLAAGQDGATHRHRIHADKYAGAGSQMVPTERLVDIACVNGFADVFPCSNVDLLSFVPFDEFYEADPSTVDPLTSAELSEVWGWANPQTGNEFAIIGMYNGVGFFNVTDPYAPVYLGRINSDTPGDLVWFDVKTYRNFAIITSESTPFGMLTFDLTRLEGVTAPQSWTADAVYAANLTAHNVVVNEATSFAYLVGSGTIAGALTSAGGDIAGSPVNTTVAAEPCRSGLHAVDLADPTLPVFAGCFALDGYVHDAQCVVYDGPDADYSGREICFAYNENEVVIIDMTDKILASEIARFSYDQLSYTHQGWLTEDGRHILFNDEGEEATYDINTRTLVADVSDLDNPTLVGEYLHDTTSIDHNNYVLDGLAYQSNYTSGLRILDLDGIATAELQTIGWFDTYPDHDDPVYAGTWGNYPYLPSGNIIISGGEEGLFVVRLHEDVRQAHATDCGGNEISDREPNTVTVCLMSFGGTISGGNG